MQLAELLQVVDRQIVAGQVQQGVDQHRAVAVGEHEAVAVGPLGVGRVVAQVVVPQHLGDLGHAHGRARVAGVGLLHGVHGQGADRAGQVVEHGGIEIAESGHCVSSSTVDVPGKPKLSAKPGGLCCLSAEWQSGAPEDPHEVPVARRSPYLELRFHFFSMRSRMIGDSTSCMASSILPPGTTMMFGRDMKESWIMVSR